MMRFSKTIISHGLEKCTHFFESQVIFFMERAALYIRVSTEEQAMHGYSLEAQREALTRYAKEHDLFIVDYYVDEGKSARKRYTKRKEFMRMMEDVECNKLDVILFIKLDRWFRNIADYYKIQEILEAHHVNWRTTEEHYDTSTTNGRLYINIRLSVAQDESDRDSDRIKFVFENKISRGEAITGAVPLGFKIEDKHLVADEGTVKIAQDIFAYYDLHNNKTATRRYILEKYGLSITMTTLQRMLRNTMYKGEYRGISGYCEALIEPQIFDRVKERAQTGNVRKTGANRTYIFSSLLICAECGRKMVGHLGRRGSREYYLYRCNYSANLKLCEHKRCINEREIEEYLLNHIEEEINSYIVDYEVKAAQKLKPKTDKGKIKRKMEKLKELYINELITMEEYKKDYETYIEQLAETEAAPVPTPNYKALEGFKGNEFKGMYKTMEREERRSLWRSIITSIKIDKDNNIVLCFTSLSAE